MRFIECNLEADVSLGVLAAEVGLSVFYFARLFKLTTGKSPHQFVLERRIDLAQQLLTKTEEPLAVVALRCGWANQSHFTTAFKQKVGITPRRYRNRRESLVNEN